MKHPIDDDPNNVRVGQNFLDYLLYERGSSENTVLAYKNDIKKWFAFCRAEKYDPLEITQDKVNRFLLGEQSEGSKKSTIQRSNAMLRSFAKFLVYDQEKKDLPSLSPLGKLEKRLPELMTEGEISRIINVCATGKPLDERDKTIIELTYGTGLRASEVCRLKLKDADFSRGVLYILGKGGKERIVPLVGGVKRSLENYIQNYRPKLNKLNAEEIFLSRTGKPLPREYLWAMLHKRGMKAGISSKRLHPHVLRHTFATHLLRNGMNIRSLQVMLGHSSIMTTEKYTHLDTELRDLYDKYHPHAK